MSSVKKLTCFKTYDIRGEVGKDLSESVIRRIARAVTQHLKSTKVIVGYDARASSISYAKAAIDGINEAGSDALDIGLSGTEEVYWAVNEFNASAGLEITASHNPINFNGIKIVKSGSAPLDQINDFKKIQEIAETEEWEKVLKKGSVFDISTRARELFARKILSFIDINNLKPLKVLVNSGNGAAGPAFKAIEKKLQQRGSKIKFCHVLDQPDPEFPFGIPNPMLKESQAITGSAVVDNGADIGVAFDGDFDRCFFFDRKGRFVKGEYIVGLLAESFLEKEAGASIIYDPRVVFNIESVIKEMSGVGIISKTGHTFLKEAMRKNNAVFGGEVSAHHYFRDFAFCDSGMITCFLFLECLSKKDVSIETIIENKMRAFPSSGELNFSVKDPQKVMDEIFNHYKEALSTDFSDGMSMFFGDWRFNIRKSNTEPLVRLNVESKGSNELVKKHTDAITKLIVNINRNHKNHVEP